MRHARVSSKLLVTMTAGTVGDESVRSLVHVGLLILESWSCSSRISDFWGVLSWFELAILVAHVCSFSSDSSLLMERHWSIFQTDVLPSPAISSAASFVHIPGLCVVLTVRSVEFAVLSGRSVFHFYCASERKGSLWPYAFVVFNVDCYFWDVSKLRRSRIWRSYFILTFKYQCYFCCREAATLPCSGQNLYLWIGHRFLALRDWPLSRAPECEQSFCHVLSNRV